MGRLVRGYFAFRKSVFWPQFRTNLYNEIHHISRSKTTSLIGEFLLELLACADQFVAYIAGWSTIVLDF
jgi:hypothetical protein